MQLFCFTHAGGNAAFFDKLESLLSPDIELVKLEYSGHGTRRKEELYYNFSDLSDDMYSAIKSAYKTGEKYALLGYSMGSISTVEVTKKIIAQEELPNPAYIFLAAHEPFTKAEMIGYSADEIDKYVMDRTIQFGGIPETLIHNKSFWRVYLPVYRADYSMIGKYEFEKLDIKSEIPATIFYSETDTPFRDMKEWSNYFVGECEFIQYTGNHFFINEHCQEMAEVIKGRLEI